MAITPDQAYAQAVADDEKFLRDIETRIDAFLVKRVGADTYITMQTDQLVKDVPLESKNRILSRIVAIYQTAGWRVDRISKQHDGSYLKFSKMPEVDQRENTGYYKE